MMNPRTFLVFCFALPGALQGLALYALFQKFEIDFIQPGLLAIFFFVLLAPVVHHLCTEPSKRIAALLLSGLIGSVCALLIFGSYLRYSGELPAANDNSGLLVLVTVCGLLITMISLPFLRTAFIRKQSIFNYSVLFEYAWGQCICVLIALLFTLLTTLITILSVSLFNVLGFSLDDLIYQPVVMTPLLGAAFGLAIGIARENENIIHSTRHVMLALLKALLPVFMVITGVFLVTALVAGIGNIETGFSVTFLLITAMTVSIVLCNGAIQDKVAAPKGLMSLIVRIQALILPGFSALAFYGLWMRVNEYGLTHGRLIAIIITAIASLYAVGYMLSALSRSLVKNLQYVNIGVALITLAVTIALLTPVLDIHRIAVHSQVQALATGEVTAKRFDFRYLKFESGLAGKEALIQLKTMDVVNRAELDVALTQVEELTEYDYSGIPEDIVIEEFAQWLQNGNIALYQPNDDLRFEQLILHPGFSDSIRYSCIETDSRCVIMQTTQFNSAHPQYVLAKALSEDSLSLYLYFLDDQQQWKSAIDGDTFWLSGTVSLPAEQLTQFMDQLSVGNLEVEPVAVQGIKMGDFTYIPGIGTVQDVLLTK